MRLSRCCPLVIALCMAVVANAFAASPDFSPDRLRKVLSGRSSAQQQKLLSELTSVEQLDEAQSAVLIETLQTSLKSDKTLSRADLMLVWHLRHTTGETTDDALLLTLEHADPRAQLLAIDAAAIRKPEKLFEPLLSLKQSPGFAKSFAYRRGLVDAIAAYAKTESVAFLVELLPSATGELERSVVLHLQRLTRQPLTNNPTAWKTWWVANAATYSEAPATKLARAMSETELAEKWNGPLPEFFNVALFGNKIVFVIDRSKSMESSVGSETRLDVAQRELYEAIGQLRPEVEFNIITFDESVEVWQSTLVPASGEAKADAARYIYSIFTGNKTATYDSLAQSLTFDPNTEQLILLSDGKPTAGSVTDIDTIIARITEQNLFLRASIDTLGIDTEGEHERLMKSLAEQNFGTYTKIR